MISVFEIFSVFAFNSPVAGGEVWSIRDDFESGNLGFDPLGLRPESVEEFKEMQTKELNVRRAPCPPGLLALAALPAPLTFAGSPRRMAVWR